MGNDEWQTGKKFLSLSNPLGLSVRIEVGVQYRL